MERSQIVDMLNTARANELIAVGQYMNHYYIAEGIDGVQVSGTARDHAMTEMKHAEQLAERIVMLGGRPIAKPNEVNDRTTVGTVKSVDDGSMLEEMIKQDLGDEYKAVKDYTDMINTIGNNDIVTRRLLEDILAVEEEHAHDLENLLAIEPQAIPVSMGEEAPEEATRHIRPA